MRIGSHCLTVLLLLAAFCLPAVASAQDTDGDGLSDQLEVQRYNTDPFDDDTDDDGLTDGIEVQQGGSSRRCPVCAPTRAWWCRA